MFPGKKKNITNHYDSLGLLTTQVDLHPKMLGVSSQKWEHKRVKIRATVRITLDFPEFHSIVPVILVRRYVILTKPLLTLPSYYRF